MITGHKHFAENVRDLTAEDREKLKPKSDPLDGDQMMSCHSILDQTVDQISKFNHENGNPVGALQLRASWAGYTQSFMHVQWALVEALDEVETLKDRVALLEEELGTREQGK